MSTRRKRHEEHEEHENHERWLITYADMITLLMAFFIMLFTMSQLDLAKFKEFQQGFANKVSGNDINLAAEGGVGVLDGGPTAQELLMERAEQILNEKEREDLARDLERDKLLNVEKEFTRRVEKAGLAGKVGFRLEQRGLVVTIVSDHVLFDNGSAELRAQGRNVLDGLIGVLHDMPNDIAVEGHTDNVPITGGGQYANNWVLSTARATSVLSYMLSEHGLEPSRLSAAGYADQRPVKPNTSTENRAANRRVEIVVLANTAPREGT
jgi:chemotaxis protein MotB